MSILAKVVNDHHPHRLHEGAVLFLVKGVEHTEYGSEEFLTGFRVNHHLYERQGMFDKISEPIQVLEKWDSDAHTVEFSMCNLGTLKRAEINELLKKGEIKYGDYDHLTLTLM